MIIKATNVYMSAGAKRVYTCRELTGKLNPNHIVRNDGGGGILERRNCCTMHAHTDRNALLQPRCGELASLVYGTLLNLVE